MGKKWIACLMALLLVCGSIPAQAAAPELTSQSACVMDADIVICAAEDIPDDTDILVTHWPPYGILDNDLGSLNILNFVLKAQPWWHLFGHIHETEGQQFQLGRTICQNISVFNAIS